MARASASVASSSGILRVAYLRQAAAQPSVSPSQPRNVARLCHTSDESGTLAARADKRSAARCHCIRPTACRASSNSLFHGTSARQGLIAGSSLSSNGALGAEFNCTTISTG